MAISDHALIEAWKEVLTLSALKKGEQVTILTNDEARPQSVATCRLAATQMGAYVTIVQVWPGSGSKSFSPDRTGLAGESTIAGNIVALQALKCSDLVIDMVLLFFSKEQEEVLKGKTRILLAVEPPEVLVRMRPRASDKIRAENAGKRLASATTMAVKSAAGTDFTCRLDQYPVLIQKGFVDKPVGWDHFPSCFVAKWPNEGSSEGTIIIDAGDILLPFKHYARSPITLTIEQGFVRKVAGGADAEYLDAFMRSFNDLDACAMAHVGWGLHDRAHWTTLGMYDPQETIGMDARSYIGNFMFSTGPNTEAGGTRATQCHMDIPLRNCSVYLDDEPVVLDGKLVQPDQTRSDKSREASRWPHRTPNGDQA